MSFLQLNQVTVVKFFLFFLFFVFIKLALAYRNFRIYLKIYNPYQRLLAFSDTSLEHVQNLCFKIHLSLCLSLSIKLGGGGLKDEKNVKI